MNNLALIALAEMTSITFAIGSVVLAVNSISAAHIRQRLYWGANSNEQRLQGQAPAECADQWTIGAKGMACRMGNTEHNGLSPAKITRSSLSSGNNSTQRTRVSGESERTSRSSITANLPGCEEWKWINCKDGKSRPIEPGILPLAHGVPRGMVHSRNPNASQEARKMRLHGYGNAIVPQVAAEFIRAFYKSSVPYPNATSQTNEP